MKHVGSYIVLPFNPSANLSVKNEDGQSVSLISNILPLLAECLYRAIESTYSFVYIFYPVSNKEWLLETSHTSLLYNLYYIANVAAYEQNKFSLDIRVFPLLLSETDGGYQFVTESQRQMLYMLFDATYTFPHCITNISKWLIGCFTSISYIWDILKDSHKHEEIELLPYINTLHDLSNDHTERQFFKTLYHAVQSSLYVTQQIQCICKSSDLHQVHVITSRFSRSYILHDLLAGVPNQPTFQSVRNSLIGGTFDRLHSGHKYLLSIMAFMSNKRMTIGITADTANFISKKCDFFAIQPEILRVYGIAHFIETFLILTGICSDAEFECSRLPNELKQFNSIIRMVKKNKFNISFMFPYRRKENIIPHAKSLIFSPSSPFIESSHASSSVCMPIRTTHQVHFGFHKKKYCDDKTPLKGNTLFDSMSGIVNLYTVREWYVYWCRLRRSIRNDRKKCYKNKRPHTMKVQLSLLKDTCGPAAYEKDIDCLILTEETLKGGLYVNKMREEVYGLPLVPLVILPTLSLLAWDNTASYKMSSTLIRQYISSTFKLLDIYWTKASYVLKFPSVFRESWRHRLLELYSVSWREYHRKYLHILCDRLWDRQDLQEQDRGWITVILWLSVLSVTNIQNEQSVLDEYYSSGLDTLNHHDIVSDASCSREKCINILRAFCSDMCGCCMLENSRSKRSILEQIWDVSWIGNKDSECDLYSEGGNATSRKKSDWIRFLDLYITLNSGCLYCMNMILLKFICNETNTLSRPSNIMRNIDSRFTYRRFERVLSRLSSYPNPFVNRTKHILSTLIISAC